MTKRLPAPDNDDTRPTDGPQRSGGYRRQSKEIPIPSVDKILAMLMQLNSVLITGVISPQTANLIQRNLRTILGVQMKRQGSGDGGPSCESLVEACRRDPQLINELAPFLTDDVFDALMRAVAEPPDEPV